MSTFYFLTICIALVGVAGFCWALLKERDVFHPLAYLMPMVLFLYVFLPAELIYEDLFDFSAFTVPELTKVQAFNAACIFALVAGVLRGGRARAGQNNISSVVTPREAGHIFAFAVVLGVVSLAAFAFNVQNVGGLLEAYSEEKGGGRSDSGYLRDAVFWSVSALAALGACVYHDGLRTRYIVAGLFFWAPMFIHGLFAGRRGPTFIAFATLSAAYYLGRNKRPAAIVFVVGGACLGLLLLLEVTFRDQFRLGSGIFQNPAAAVEMMVDQLAEERSAKSERVLRANEFIYGVDVVTRFNEGTMGDRCYWGKRILTIMFVRPIPSQFWPNKYKDVGMGQYLVNVGLGGVDQYSTVAYGAAPGFAADLFAEFSWGAIAVSFLIGWCYGRVWNNAIQFKGIWLMLYVLFFALSIFFVVQTLEAILYRFLLTALPLIGFWRLMIHKKQRPVLEHSLSGTSLEAPGR